MIFFFLKSITLFPIYSTGTESQIKALENKAKNKSKIILWRTGVLLELGTVWWISLHSPFVQRGSQEAYSRSTDPLSVPSDERCGERYSLPGLQACSAIKNPLCGEWRWGWLFLSPVHSALYLLDSKGCGHCWLSCLTYNLQGKQAQHSMQVVGLLISAFQKFLAAKDIS